MRILFLCDEYPPLAVGGIGRFTQQIGQWLVSKGHEVNIVGLYDANVSATGPEDDRGVAVYRIPRVSSTGLGKLDVSLSRVRLYRAVRHLIRTAGVQLVEAPDYQAPLWFVPHTVPRVLRVHSAAILLRRQAEGPLTRAERMEDCAARNATHYVAVSEWARTLALSHWAPLKDKRVEVVGNPIAEAFFSPIPLEAARERDWIVFSGTIAKHKGVRELLEAWDAVRERYPTLSLQLFGKDGDCGDLVRSAVADQRRRVAWHGSVDECGLLSAYARACLGVFPSYFESEGLAAKEAAAAGLTLLVSRIPSYQELFGSLPGVTMSTPRDAKDLARQLDKVLRARQESAAGTLQDAMQPHRIDVIGGRNIAFYERIVTEWHRKKRR